MVLKSDFLLDGANHSRLFDFEVEVTKTIDKESEQKKLTMKEREQRFKTVVCRHWVKDLCMKGEDCEYLHELNPARMPECRWGAKCQVPDCMFKHTREEDRIECMFYKIGFCRKGLICRFRHVRRAPEELPEEINWDDIGEVTQLQVTEVTKIEDGIEKTTVVQHNQNYKVAICKHWKQTGECPFRERCHFAHGVHELRRPNADDGKGAGPTDIPATNFSSAVDDYQNLSEQAGASRDPFNDMGDDLRLPDIEFFQSHYRGPPPAYFILRADSLDYFVGALKYRCWSVLPPFMDTLNEAFRRAPMVILIFASDEQQEFVACGVMRGPAERARDVPFVNIPKEADGFSFLFDLEIFRIASLDFRKTAFLTTPNEELCMDIPVPMAYECSQVPMDVGHALLIMLFREQEIAIDPAALPDEVRLTVHMEGPPPGIYELVDDHIEKVLQFKLENPSYTFQSRHLQDSGSPRGGRGDLGFRGGNNRRQNMMDVGQNNLVDPQQQIIGPGGVPVAAGSVAISPKYGGFIIGCSDPNFCKEMMDLGLLGAPIDRKSEMSVVVRGTAIVIFDLTEDKIFGIFEATGASDELINPNAFRKSNERDAPCELPIQVPCRRILNGPPLVARHVPSTVFNADEGEQACFQKIEPMKMQQLANLFAKISQSNRTKQQQQQQMEAELASSYPPGISVHDMPTSKPGTIAKVVIINVDFPEEFKAAHRLIGKGGANVKRVKSANPGIRCAIKSVVSAPAQGQQQQEIVAGPMQIQVFANVGDEGHLDNAIGIALDMAEDLLRRYDDFLDFDRRGGGGRDDDSMSRRSNDYGGRRGRPPPPRDDDAMSRRSGDSRHRSMRDDDSFSRRSDSRRMPPPRERDRDRERDRERDDGRFRRPRSRSPPRDWDRGSVGSDRRSERSGGGRGRRGRGGGRGGRGGRDDRRSRDNNHGRRDDRSRSPPGRRRRY